jgi:hypothetical protein
MSVIEIFFLVGSIACIIAAFAIDHIDFNNYKRNRKECL